MSAGEACSPKLARNMSEGGRRLPLTTLHFSYYMRGRRRGVPMAALTRTLCLTVLIAFGADIVSAQTATGGIRGFAKDDTGGVLAGVTVEASSPARIGAAAVEVTDAQGLYGFENLPPGEY